MTRGAAKADVWSAADDRKRGAVDAWIFLAVGVPAVIGIATVAVFPQWAGTLGESMTAMVLIVALCACGLVLVREPGQHSSGILMLIAAGLVALSWSYLAPDPFPYLASAFSWVWLFLVAWVILRYPSGRLAVVDRWILGATAVDLLLLPFVDATLGAPEWFGFARGSFWLGVPVSPGLHTVLSIVQQGLLAVLAITVCVRLVVDLRATPAVNRGAQSGVFIALAAAIGIGAGTAIAKAMGAQGFLIDDLDTIGVAFFLLVPVAFLWLVIRNRLVEQNRADAVTIPDPGAHSLDDVTALLTPRERAVLELLAQGASNAAIQARLRATPGSVERAIGNIYSKLAIPDDPTVNRRVAAVLHWQRSRD